MRGGKVLRVLLYCIVELYGFICSVLSIFDIV